MTKEERRLALWVELVKWWEDQYALARREIEQLAKENTDLWGIIRKCQNDVLVAERERDEVLCRLKGTMQ